jgi:hypothetical protein
MNDATNLRDTVIPKSDQLNADDLLVGPMDITVTKVRRGSGKEQPVDVHWKGGEGRPFKPCKTMRRVLIAAWTDDGAAWVGRSMRLYCDPDVTFGDVRTGGIRISHMTDIQSDPLILVLTATRGRKKEYRIQRLVLDEPWADAWGDTIAGAATVDELRTSLTEALAEAKRRKDAPAAARLRSIADTRKAEIDPPLENPPIADEQS